MDSKKHPKANLESRRGLFFLIGLSVALVAAIIVFQWTTVITYEPEPDFKPRKPAWVDIDVPITVHTVAKAEPEPKTKQNSDTRKIVDEIVKTIIEVPDPFKGDPGQMEDPEPLQFGDDGLEPEEPIETIIPVLVENIARPLPCADVRGKEQQQACLNEWMAQYLQKNIQYPSRMKAMGLEDAVTVSFIINHKGEVERVQVRGRHEDFNREAERVISELPLFEPASHFGKKVKMPMSLPVNFKVR